VTAAALLDVDPEYATGEVIEEIFLPFQAGDHPQREVPVRNRLFQNYPNPFNSTTIIRFDVTDMTWGKLSIHSIMGQEIALIAQGPFSEGTHKLGWDGKDTLGRDMPTGMYLLRLTTPEYSQTIRMLMLK
jgi:hypothetical protein